MANNAEAVEMEKELYVAAMEDNVVFLEGQSDEYLLRKTRQNTNLVYIAIRYEQLEFIEACLEKFPNNYRLISDRELSNENTPLHIAAELRNLDIMRLLHGYCEKGDEKPWRLKNSKGNTAVHVALIHGNIKVARFLLEQDPGLACIPNNSNEAPLHLAIKHHVNYVESESMLVRIKQPIHEGGAGLPIEYELKEGMSSMIELLVEKASSVASWPDSTGLTPLLRAASLGTPYNLQTIRLLIQQCPQSAEVCDANGKSILHLLINKIPSYHDASRLLCLIEIFSLRNQQDQHGNTPLHTAAKNKDINMVRALLEAKANLDINNSDGISVTCLIQQQEVLQMLRQREMTDKEGEAADSVNIAFLEERWSELGADFLHSKDPKGRNFLHRLMQIKNESHIMHEAFVGFVKELVDSFPAIVCQTDHNKNTPVHILVQKNNGDSGNTINNYGQLSLKLLEIYNRCILENQHLVSKNIDCYDLPWLVRNTEGNTPLHEAIIANNKRLALRLLEYNRTAAAMVNQRKKTPLHLLAQSDEIGELKKTIEKMVDASREAASLPDEDGLTPIMRAFKAGKLSSAAMLCTVSPEAAEIGDMDGNTFWHLIIKHPSHYYVYCLLKNKALRGVLEKGNMDGNTPLHTAIQANRFDIVLTFLDVYERERKELPAMDNHGRHHRRWLIDLLNIPNKAGITPSDLIQDAHYLPRQVEASILRNEQMKGIRSAWNISASQLNNYMNSMNVIAALLTTITFTAAFTVPGGLIQDIGTPVLIRSTAFKVFLISDVVAMCLSMAVLICLLWIMATSKKRTSVMIQDLTVTLLLAAFVATLLTFMAGVYATVFPVNPRIAIATLVLCSFTALLIFRKIVTWLLLPIRNTTLNFYRMIISGIVDIVHPRKKSPEEFENQ